MTIGKLVLLTLAIIAIAKVLDAVRPKAIRIFKFEGVCEGHENIPLTLRDIHLMYSNKIHLVSLKSVATEDIPEDLKMTLELKRCQSREALDTCESYQTIRLKNLCRLINADNKPWSPLTKMLEPRMECPIKKGTYVVKNGTLDAGPFSHFPIAGWYWVVKVLIYGQQSNQLKLCVNFEGQLVSS